MILKILKVTHHRFIPAVHFPVFQFLIVFAFIIIYFIANFVHFTSFVALLFILVTVGLRFYPKFALFPIDFNE